MGDILAMTPVTLDDASGFLLHDVGSARTRPGSRETHLTPLVDTNQGVR